MKETDDKRNYTTMELLPEAQCIYFMTIQKTERIEHIYLGRRLDSHQD